MSTVHSGGYAEALARISADNDTYDENRWEDERQDQARQKRPPHWCFACHGRTGPGSPCFDEPDEAEGED